MGDVYVNLMFDGYTVYANNGYYLCVSNEQIDNYQMYVGFSNKDISTLSKESVINEIKKIGNLIQSNDRNGIYVLPIISPLELEQAALENDDREYNRILNSRVQPITMDVYKRFTSMGKKISDTINMIKQNDTDGKFIGWMSMKLGNNFIREIDYRSLGNNVIMENDTPMVQNSTSVVNSDAGIAPVNHQYDGLVQTKSNKLVKKLVKQIDVSPGFGNIKFIIVVLIFALVVGVTLGTLLMK